MSVSELQKKLQIQSLPPMPAVGPNANSKRTRGNKKDYSPLGWDEFFDQKQSVEISSGNTFNVYRKGDTGLLFLLLHGGGYSGLTWACFSEEIFQLLDCQILAIDFRGHGDTVTEDEEDFSSETLTNDVLEVFRSVFKENNPSVVIMGHSMGGAIAVRVGTQIQSLVGLAVIDVVEGSAMQALEGMHQFLRGRPQSFTSIEAAVEWCVRSGTVRNLKSARVSMPSQVKQASNDAILTLQTGTSELTEVNETDQDQADPQSQSKDPSPLWTWRIDLEKTASFWAGWFRGLSALFLSVPVPKLLLLAGVDRLDKDLTVGQMQGKFQMVVLPKVGHALHEDSPLRVAEAIAFFCTRNKLTTAKTEFKPVFPGC